MKEIKEEKVVKTTIVKDEIEAKPIKKKAVSKPSPRKEEKVEKVISAKTACDMQRISKRMQFVVNKMFSKRELHTSTEWANLFIAKRIV